MHKGIPKSASRDTPVALRVKRLTNVPLIGIGVFRAISQKEDRDTKEKYEVEQVKLSCDFDSGHPQRNADGELILDEDGREIPHLINDGFVTLSGHENSNFVAMLKALGFGEAPFIDPDTGGLSSEAAESIELTFGTNRLGDDYSNAEWDELPMYELRSRGGKVGKRDIEVPVTSFKILGYELLGRRCDIALKIKDEYNRVDFYLEPENPEPLDTTPQKRRGIPATEPKPEPHPMDVPRKEVEDNLRVGGGVPPMQQGNPGEPEPESKQARYVTKRMQESNVPGAHRLAVLRAMTGNPDIESIHGVSVADANTFRDMFKANPTSIVDAYHHVIDTVKDDDAFVDDDEEWE